MKTLTQRIAVLGLALAFCAGLALAVEPASTKLQGKLGDELSTGQWQLQVISVEKSATYVSQFLEERTTITPDAEGEELVAIKCRITNDGKESQMPMLSHIHPHHTALTDAQGKSFLPLAFDKQGGHTDEGVRLEPGAATSFTVLFSVPKDSVPAGLTFSLQIAFEDYPNGGTDVHVELGK